MDQSHALVELYLPNRKTLQDLFVPPESELANGEPRCQVFNFPLVNPLETQEQAWTFDRTMLVWAMTGTMVNSVAPGAVVAAGFRFQILQTHRNPANGLTTRRPWFNKHQLQSNILGTGSLPTLLRKTHPIDAGDTVTMEVKSMVLPPAAATICRIQICLFGVIVPDEPGA
ncbi:MAG: hypothetical protein LAP21_15150 [Acidobacteriia bacterium]|nr:hypothetical protein [Terriglobia bacterium]